MYFLKYLFEYVIGKTFYRFIRTSIIYSEHKIPYKTGCIINLLATTRCYVSGSFCLSKLCKFCPSGNRVYECASPRRQRPPPRRTPLPPPPWRTKRRSFWHTSKGTRLNAPSDERLRAVIAVTMRRRRACASGLLAADVAEGGNK